MHVEESVVINQPVEKVFGYVSNPANQPEWAGPVVDVHDLQQTAPGEWREGDRFTLVGKFLGRF
ncbi:MAG TPA: SRPBCC family protein [Rubrobacteraceae bacterium]|nr:SRPBCC family protein [Rubrobacteraceae bacterium]